MSIEALNWALRQNTGSPTAKLVLMLLADRHNPTTGICYPGIDRIARESEMSRRSVIRHVKRLEQAGLLTVVHRGGTGEGRKSNEYRLHIEQCDNLAHRAKCQNDTSNVPNCHGQSDTLSPEPKVTQSNPKTNGAFDSFWRAYPKKRGKKPAKESWTRKRLDSIGDQLVADVQRRLKEDAQWLRGYIPNPSTYLNQERWNDEFEPVVGTDGFAP